MPQRRRTPYIPILTGVTLAFVLASLMFIGLMIYYNNPFVQIGEKELPNLVGIKYETAITQNDAFDIVLDEPDGTVYSDEWGKGVIIEQKPKAGLMIKLGSQVKVKVSLGPLVVQLPNFAGKEARQTFSWLKDHGLEYKEKRDYSEDVSAGCVIYTDPSKDSALNSGSVVTVYVSMGPERLPVEVPDVTGLKAEDARAALERKMMIAGSYVEQYSSVPVGVVIGQDPPGGSMVNEGTTITLIVSSGPDPKELEAERRKSMGSARLRVLLPDIDQEILIRARINDVVVAEATLNPAKRTSKYWSPTIYTDEVGEVTVKVYVDKKFYESVTVTVEPPEPPPEESDSSDDE